VRVSGKLNREGFPSQWGSDSSYLLGKGASRHSATVVRAVQSGQSCRSVADVFGVSVASVVKWSQRHRSTGSAAAKPMGSRRPFILEAERGWPLSRVREEPEITTRALACELAARGIVVSHMSA
jgi:transposase